VKESVKTIFTVIGSVIGAGFISGRELVRFFGGEAFPPFLLLAGLLFFVYIFFLLRAGKKYGGFTSFCRVVFGKGEKAVQIIFCFCSFVVVAAMLAGINALEESYQPFIAVLTAVGCFFLVKKGVNGLNMLNLLLVPFILAYIIVGLVTEGEFAFVAETQNAGMGGMFVWIYAAMNIFLSSSVVMDCGARLGKQSQITLVAVISSLVIGGCIALILSAIGAKEGAKEHTMPLLYVLKRGKLFPLIGYFGIVTTLISSYYPLHIFPKGKHKDAARLFTLAAASVCSLFGLKEIVEYAYPVMGGLGILFLSVVIFHDDLFEKGYHKIHDARQKAENDRRRHDQIKLKHLPARDDKVSEPRLGDDVFPHDRADPRHAHVDL
jgi:uncharacterized membrane protein YkvI